MADEAARTRTTFTLSQAVVSRGATSFNAFGTMLLSQDVGQSLFLVGEDRRAGLARRACPANLRVIARRVFLDKAAALEVNGRGTLDAKRAIRRTGSSSRRAGRRAPASSRSADADHERFDHLTVNGKLERDAGDFLLKFADLQLTRGARLERAPNVFARLRIEPGTTRVARTTLRPIGCRSWPRNSWPDCSRRSWTAACPSCRAAGHRPPA